MHTGQVMFAICFLFYQISPLVMHNNTSCTPAVSQSYTEYMRCKTRPARLTFSTKYRRVHGSELNAPLDIPFFVKYPSILAHRGQNLALAQRMRARHKNGEIFNR